MKDDTWETITIEITLQDRMGLTIIADHTLQKCKD